MEHMTDLSTLLSRVERGSGADFPLQQELWRVFDANGRLPVDFLTDLNAVIALVEARLPGWGWDITYRAAWGNSAAHVIGPTREAKPYVATAPTPARALLAALIRAEMETVK